MKETDMVSLDNNTRIGVVGAGRMGMSIARMCASKGHKIFIYEVSENALSEASERLEKELEGDEQANLIDEQETKRIIGNISFIESLENIRDCGLIIEAVDEDLETKQRTFNKIETALNDGAVLATNTSSLSVTSIASACACKERITGMHFFYPADQSTLVEIIPGLETSEEVIKECTGVVKSWNKKPLKVTDTPGFLVNRITRPYFNESLRIYEENIADIPFIDFSLREYAGFGQGPFERMDTTGIDIDYPLSENLFDSFYYDNRFRPSLTEKRLYEAGYYGKKTGKGFYNYKTGEKTKPETDKEKSEYIIKRVLSLLLNETADAMYLGIAADKDIPEAISESLGYKGNLFEWADKTGLDKIIETLNGLHSRYGDSRYFPHPLLKDMAATGKRFVI